MTPSVPSPVGDADEQRFGGASEKPRPPAGTEREARLWRLVEALDQRIDEGASPAYHEQPLAQDWARVAKVQEEAGEAIDALIGWTGQNHRKGVYDTYEHMVEELADVALTGVYAIQHFTKDAEQTRAAILDRADHHAERVGVVLAAVVSSPERDSATGLSRSDTNEASSPATPAEDAAERVGGEFIRRIAAAKSTSSPATPEGGRATFETLHAANHPWCEKCDLAPSTLPAETREGRRDAIAEVLFQYDLGIDTCECACGGWDADSSEETFEQHQADALLAASPAVSLPEEAESESELWRRSSEHWRRRYDELAAPSLPGEQPGGQER